MKRSPAKDDDFDFEIHRKMYTTYEDIEWYTSDLSRPMTLLDARDAKDYDQGHIAMGHTDSARNLEWA